MNVADLRARLAVHAGRGNGYAESALAVLDEFDDQQQGTEALARVTIELLREAGLWDC